MSKEINKKHYRIIRKSRRNDTTGGIDHLYYIDVFEKNIFGNWNCKPYKIRGYDYWETIYFNNEKQALGYAKKLIVEVPPDKLIWQI